MRNQPRSPVAPQAGGVNQGRGGTFSPHHAGPALASTGPCWPTTKAACKVQSLKSFHARCCSQVGPPYSLTKHRPPVRFLDCQRPTVGRTGVACRDAPPSLTAHAHALKAPSTTQTYTSRRNMPPSAAALLAHRPRIDTPLHPPPHASGAALAPSGGVRKTFLAIRSRMI